MKSRELRSYGRARITSEAGDTVRATLVRRSGPTPSWVGPRWTRSLYAKVSAPTMFTFALDLSHFGLRELRTAARDIETGHRARRAINRHCRARRAMGER